MERPRINQMTLSFLLLMMLAKRAPGSVKQVGGHLTKPGWSIGLPHAHSNPTNLALFRHKITVYIFNQGTHTIAGGGLKWEQAG